MGIYEWCTFMSLVLWIAIYERNIDGSLVYMDDNFGFDVDRQLVHYSPYDKFMPQKQARLLCLWDELRIPHKEEKQLFGEQLTIIGFSVDTVSMVISLPTEANAQLVSAIRDFVKGADRRYQRLRDWQRILGWINWGLNVCPLLRPALQSSYDKVAGRQLPLAPIYLNKGTSHDLLWIADMFERNEGVHLLTSKVWRPEDADIVIYCDACLSGLGFWTPTLSPGYAFATNRPPAPRQVEDNMFWYEAITVLAALEWAVAKSPSFHRVAIFTDNLNTVQMFDSFRSREPYLNILSLRASPNVPGGIRINVGKGEF